MPVKIFTVMGTRPQIVKFSKEIPHQKLIWTGQHYDYRMAGLFFKQFHVKPYRNLGCKSTDATMFNKLLALFKKEKPKIVLVYGDTFSTLMGAQAAAFAGIPLAHIEAGTRSGDSKQPEEIVRKIVDRLADVRFCFSLESFRNLHKEGLLENSFYFKGDPMFDAMNWFLPVKHRKDSGKYVLVTIHRQSNVSRERLKILFQAMKNSDKTFYFPVHPRTAKLIRKVPKNVKLLEPQGYKEMLELESNAEKIITDSGGVQREAYWMRIPVIIFRDRTEWPHIVSDGWGLLADDEYSLSEAIKNFKPTTSVRQSEPVVFGVNRLIKEKLAHYL